MGAKLTGFALLNPEQRREAARRGHAALTESRKASGALTGFALLSPQERRAMAQKGGKANDSKFIAGSERARRCGAMGAPFGLREGDPRTKTIGRLGGLKSARLRAAKKAAL